MSAGFPAGFPGGLGGGGLAPFVVTSSPPPPQTPLALQFDPTIPGFVMNTNGTMASSHPVDQAAALALFVQYGSIRSAPTVGSKFRTLNIARQPVQASAIVAGEINRCLGTLLSLKQVFVLGYQLQVTGSGRVFIAVAYVNLLDPRWTPANANVASRTISGFPGSTS